METENAGGAQTETVNREVPNGRNLMYALRMVHRSQTHLVGLADRKANVLVGIIMVTFSILLSKSDLTITLPVPLKVMLGAFLFAEGLAVYFALMVIYPKKIVNVANELADTGNPLFFGCYARFSQADFIEYLSNEFEDDVRARELMLADYYQVGLVLNKKYLMLRKAYISAAFGILVMCSLFIGSFMA